MDAVSPKRRRVYVHAGGEGDAEVEGVARVLCERAVAKGETFIMFSDGDPWPRVEELPRLRLGAGAMQKWDWPLAKFRVDGRDAAPAAEFVLESAWFGRACFSVIGRATAGRMVASLVDHLRRRRTVRGRVGRSVDVVWAIGSPPDRETLDDLAFLCDAANFRLIVIASGSAEGDTTEYFDERIEVDQAGRSRIASASRRRDRVAEVAV